MLKGRTRTCSGVNDIIRGYIQRSCLNKYSKLKKEFEHRITELTKNCNSLFCKKCELNNCYNNNLLRHKLPEDSVINFFIKNCIDYPNCRNPTVVPKKSVALEKSKDVSCRKECTDCNKNTEQPKTEEDKFQPRADAETSKIIGLERSASVKQDQDHGDGWKSRSANLKIHHEQHLLIFLLEPMMRILND
ncbi:CYIR protein [Plasmodium cynomolgi strain B]|uniref:CYIR protein n=1 Tax=Plasmodium cynomolgi (strain B) TaxID=1120755 RepID=K6UNF2_PLACD|nr:CYIR protein [Plasmodium cynomolgi strain B]GAB69433.1 CYIR protein [Plasmodium cynomolgi strain B]